MFKSGFLKISAIVAMNFAGLHFLMILYEFFKSYDLKKALIELKGPHTLRERGLFQSFLW